VIRGRAGKDALSGLEGDDLIGGGRGGDTLDGGAGNDALVGHRGSDRLLGGDDDDILSGGRGRDALDGGAGNDRLDGGQGRDRLTGGDGVDTFVFTHPGKPDKITDFSDGDIVALHSSAFADIGPAGLLDAKYFHLGAEAETRQQKILYNSDTGWLLYAEKGSQTEDPVKFAKIGKGLASFDATDVVVI
jgi:Ca2+-binding RTX toxin-like protein